MYCRTSILRSILNFPSVGFYWDLLGYVAFCWILARMSWFWQYVSFLLKQEMSLSPPRPPYSHRVCIYAEYFRARRAFLTIFLQPLRMEIHRVGIFVVTWPSPEWHSLKVPCARAFSPIAICQILLSY